MLEPKVFTGILVDNKNVRMSCSSPILAGTVFFSTEYVTRIVQILKCLSGQPALLKAIATAPLQHLLRFKKSVCCFWCFLGGCECRNIKFKPIHDSLWAIKFLYLGGKIFGKVCHRAPQINISYNLANRYSKRIKVCVMAHLYCC
jgi:hypothetical protein